jgi:HEAT repeat protein
MTGRLLPVTLAAGLVCALAQPAAAFDWIGKIELDAEKLRSDNADERLQAVRRLGQYERSSLLLVKPHLLRALSDRNVDVRIAAGKVLAQLEATEAVKPVVAWLLDPDVTLRVAATEILGDLGDPAAAKPLIRSLGDAEPNVRLHAVRALGKLGTPDVVVPLISRLEDTKPEVKKAAIDQLAELADKRALIPLVGAMSDSSVDVRTSAIRAVGKLGDTSAVPALIRLVGDSHDAVRGHAIEALGDLKASEATDRLIDAMGSGSLEFRTRAAIALGRIAGANRDARATRRAIRALVTGLANNQTRSAAREALLAAGAAGVPGLIASLRGELDGHPATVVGLLRDLGDRRATPVLLEELERGRLARELILEALGASGDRRALVPVLTLLSDGDPAIRLAAMKALEPMLGASSQAADVLIDMLDDPTGEIRRLAIRYLGHMRARVASRRLATLARGAAKIGVRLEALRALAEIADPAVTDDLLALLSSGPPDVKREASHALVRLGAKGPVEPLIAMIRKRRSQDRALLVETLGGVLRNRPHDKARALLIELAREARTRLSVAALGALSATGDREAERAVRTLLRAESVDRRRAAAEALGNLGTGDSVPALISALGDDDRVASAAALALGQLGATGAVPALERATRRRSFATPVTASAALAMLADRARPRHFKRLIHHPRRLVRANAALVVGRAGHRELVDELVYLMSRDPSPAVRLNAARALSRLGAGADALAHAADHDPQKDLRSAIAELQKKPFTPPGRDHWRVFFVVEPTTQSAVAQEPYFIIGSDGIATAHYSDPRGVIAVERFAPGDQVPRNMLGEGEI